MNEYIFYTPEGYTIAPNENVCVDNCQMIGTAKGKDEREARKNLLRENSWIIDAGFNPTEFMIRRLADSL